MSNDVLKRENESMKIFTFYSSRSISLFCSHFTLIFIFPAEI